MGTSYVLLLYHLQAQLLLTGYKQPGRDVSGSHNGQIGAPKRARLIARCVPVAVIPVKFRQSSYAPAFFAGRVLRVSAVARRAAAAYGDANML